jgi:hypothetical protein
VKRIALLLIVGLTVGACETTTRYIINSEVVKEAVCKHGLGLGHCKDKLKVDGDSIVVDSLD